MKDIKFSDEGYKATPEDMAFVERVMENYYGINKEKENEKEKTPAAPSPALY
jgi:hypothetical protein